MRGVGEIAVHVKLRYVHRDVDRYGNVRHYFRRAKGHLKHQIKFEPGSQAFLDRYKELRASHGAAPAIPEAAADGSEPDALADPGPIKPDTFRWLFEEYQKSAIFKSLAPSTQNRRRNNIEAMLAERVRPGSPDTYDAMPLRSLTSKNLKVLRERKAGLPEALNQRVRALRHLFAWAHEAEHLAANPAREIKKIAHKSAGHHTWTVEEVERFEARWPVGSKARLALALLLWTGARRSDVYLFGRQHVRDGWLKFRARKNDVLVEAPVLPCLQEVIDASPTGNLAFLTTEVRGTPFKSEASFGNWFGKMCREAKVPGRAHGLRKAGATTAAENGATAHQLMAIFGWLTLAEAERYTKAAQRKKMAGDGMGLLVRTGTKDPNR
jgi:integrase